MKTFGLIPIWLAALALAGAGCAGNAAGYAPTYDLPPIREGTLARLAVDGPNAYLTGERVVSGRYVKSAETVTTGPGTSAMRGAARAPPMPARAEPITNTMA